MKIIGIDPSLTSTGIAHADGRTTRVHFGARPKRLTLDQWTVRRVRVVVAAITMASQTADLAVIEGYSYGSKQKREPLGYLGYSVRAELSRLGVPYLDVAPTALKKFATGSGTASKDEMKSAAIRLLRLDHNASHDEADALWLRELGRHMTASTSRISPSDRTKHLSKLELPKGLQK